jgi:hypothetical protein
MSLIEYDKLKQGFKLELFDVLITIVLNYLMREEIWEKSRSINQLGFRPLPS